MCAVCSVAQLVVYGVCVLSVVLLNWWCMVCVCAVCSVAQLGSHLIYKIESTNMIYIPHSTVRIIHPDEFKYVCACVHTDLAGQHTMVYLVSN